MTKRPYGAATRHVIAYLSQHGEGTARQIADAGTQLRAACNVAQILRRHGELFRVVGYVEWREMWGLVEPRTTP